MCAFRLRLAAILALVSFSGPASAAGDPADTHPDLQLIPWPKALKSGVGHMPLTAESRIVAGEEQLKPLAEVLANEIATLTDLKLKVTTDPARAGDIVLRINKALKSDEQILVLRNREPARTTDGAHTVPASARGAEPSLQDQLLKEPPAALVKAASERGDAGDSATGCSCAPVRRCTPCS